MPDTLKEQKALKAAGVGVAGSLLSSFANNFHDELPMSSFHKSARLKASKTSSVFMDVIS
jgi:hypothetical protein